MSWQKLLESCVSETSPEKLEQLVFKTEDAIFLRSQELAIESHIPDEFQALNRASRILLDIKTRELGWPDPFKVNGELNDSQKPSVVLAGTVSKVIPAANGDPEKMQISVQDADNLYREIRIENALQDGGKPIALKQGTEVDVTIEADPPNTKG